MVCIVVTPPTTFPRLTVLPAILAILAVLWVSFYCFDNRDGRRVHSPHGSTVAEIIVSAAQGFLAVNADLDSDGTIRATSESTVPVNITNTAQSDGRDLGDNYYGLNPKESYTFVFQEPMIITVVAA
ncbi:hypothetical protein Dform_00519 [Dehalogenimonas formicexedens]|uniref:Uncharacterized protein n=1 Tax=Dehalogenimonas formicexedens TaxID=1839801 RepID=A0A1P8F5X0_9CHLR|nr:hypothetical protein Dform_00519 [Dehalogenimonas formicexedens]